MNKKEILDYIIEESRKYGFEEVKVKTRKNTHFMCIDGEILRPNENTYIIVCDNKRLFIGKEYLNLLSKTPGEITKKAIRYNIKHEKSHTFPLIEKLQGKEIYYNFPKINDIRKIASTNLIFTENHANLAVFTKYPINETLDELASFIYVGYVEAAKEMIDKRNIRGINNYLSIQYYWSNKKFRKKVIKRVERYIKKYGFSN